MIERILVPLDGSALAEKALSHAEALARTFGAELRILRVIEELERAEARSRFVDGPASHTAAVGYVDGILRRTWDAGFFAAGEVAEGGPATTILDHAWKSGADVVVLTTHGRSGLTPFPAGGTALKVLHRADRTVYLIPPGAPDRNVPRRGEMYRSIVVSLDGSRRADIAVGLGASLAAVHAARIVLTHVIPMPEMPRRLGPTLEDQRLAVELVRRNRLEAERYLEQVEERLRSSGFEVDTRVVESRRIVPALRRVTREEDADLLVLTAHGLSASTEWCYGGVSGRLLLQNGCPVLVHQDAPERPSMNRFAESRRAASPRPRVW